MRPSLAQLRVLIVEDEAFIALDLVHAVEDAGGEAVGPAATLAQALVLIAEGGFDAAILDVNLPDGNIGPALEALLPEVPIIMHTGVGLPLDLKVKFPSIPVFIKPAAAAVLTQHLAHVCNSRKAEGII